MNIHQNAKLTPQSRAEIVRRVLDEGQSPAAVAAAVGVCARTVRKWVARYQTEGADGLRDRSSRPHRSASVSHASARSGIRDTRASPFQSVSDYSDYYVGRGGEWR